MSVILDYMQGVGAPTLRGQSCPHAAGPALTRSSTWSPSPRTGAYPGATSKAPGGEPAQPPPVALSGEGRRGSEARSRSPARSRARGGASDEADAQRGLRIAHDDLPGALGILVRGFDPSDGQSWFPALQQASRTIARMDEITARVTLSRRNRGLALLSHEAFIHKEVGPQILREIAGARATDPAPTSANITVGGRAVRIVLAEELKKRLNRAEYVVELEVGQAKLGIRMTPDLGITAIIEGGLVDQHNRKHDDHRIEVGDRVLAVNGEWVSGAEEFQRRSRMRDTMTALLLRPVLG